MLVFNPLNLVNFVNVLSSISCLGYWYHPLAFGFGHMERLSNWFDVYLQSVLIWANDELWFHQCSCLEVDRPDQEDKGCSLWEHKWLGLNKLHLVRRNGSWNAITCHNVQGDCYVTDREYKRPWHSVGVLVMRLLVQPSSNSQSERCFLLVADIWRPRNKTPPSAISLQDH